MNKNEEETFTSLNIPCYITCNITNLSVVERKIWSGLNARFEIRAEELAYNINEFLSFRWFNMSNVLEQSGSTTVRKTARFDLSLVYFAL